jgi:hypothetical protein
LKECCIKLVLAWYNLKCVIILPTLLCYTLLVPLVVLTFKEQPIVHNKWHSISVRFSSQLYYEPWTDQIFAPGKGCWEHCSEHGPICHLFELILVIHVNTSNGTNHFVEQVFVGISRSHGCYHNLTYHAQANMSYPKLTYHGHVRLLIAIYFKAISNGMLSMLS